MVDDEIGERHGIRHLAQAELDDARRRPGAATGEHASRRGDVHDAAAIGRGGEDPAALGPVEALAQAVGQPIVGLLRPAARRENAVEVAAGRALNSAMIVDDHRMSAAVRRRADQAVDRLGAVLDGVMADAPGHRGKAGTGRIGNHATVGHPGAFGAGADAGLIEQHRGGAIGELAARGRRVQARHHGRAIGLLAERPERQAAVRREELEMALRGLEIVDGRLRRPVIVRKHARVIGPGKGRVVRSGRGDEGDAGHRRESMPQGHGRAGVLIDRLDGDLRAAPGGDACQRDVEIRFARRAAGRRVDAGGDG